MCVSEASMYHAAFMFFLSKHPNFWMLFCETHYSDTTQKILAGAALLQECDRFNLKVLSVYPQSDQSSMVNIFASCCQHGSKSCSYHINSI